MSDSHIRSGALRMPRRTALVTLLASAGVIVLPSCGGGGGVAGVGSGGTGSYTTGRITGFGSVIINGVRFDDARAKVVDEDDTGRLLGTQDLRLGMVVEVRGSAIVVGTAATLATATATTITVESQIKGRVESRTAPDTLVVFGQTVKIDAATVFDGITFTAIVVGDVLEVHGFADSTGVVTASRIEREAATTTFKVRGLISSLDTAARTFRVGAATFNFSATVPDRLPARALANGLFVRVQTSTTAAAGNQWPVVRIDLRSPIEDSEESEVEGILLQNGSGLSVNGIPIDASRLPAGTVLPINRQVEIEGPIVSGVLVARKIEIEDENEQAKVEARGAVSALDTSARTFVVRGITFRYTVGVTQQNGGTIAANLIVGTSIEVEGRLSATGSGIVEALAIDFQT